MRDAPATVSAPARPRLRRWVVAAALATLLAALCCVGGAGALLIGDPGAGGTPVTTAVGCGQAGPLRTGGPLPRVGGLSESQLHNAAVIINVGAEMAVPPRGWVIAIATALQESVLTNLPDLGGHNDHDSIGLFQQRPSQGWGTAEQLRDPAYASRKFYAKLLTVPGWQTMPLAEAAQAVQVSAYPDAYARHEPLAVRVVNVLADGAARSAGGAAGLHCAAGGEVAASGWTAPVTAPIGSGFRTADRPTHDGVDLTAARGTPIRAAAGGRVIVVRCDAHRHGEPYPCDVDGGMTVTGCGWYVEILHADDVITRYCHLASRPDVALGQRVRAGEVIGRVGSSGHSSGPHLHFEVHLDADSSPRGAIDPVPWMIARGAPLGTAG